MKSSDIPVFPSRTDVVTLAAKTFGCEDGEFIMEILDLYGVNPSEPHREFVQAALVHYADGDVDKLLSLVDEAKCNYNRWLHHEAFSRNELPIELLNRGWDISPAFPQLPHDSPVTKKVAAHLLKVSPHRFDKLVEDGKLRPLRKTYGAYQLFEIQELERFQRENEPEVNIAEIWQAQQTT